MKIIASASIALLFAALLPAQDTFAITATPIPTSLAKLNYGPLPKNVSSLDLSICNVSNAKADLTAAQVYQALVRANNAVQPLGSSVMMAAILHNQNNSLKSWITIGLSSTTGVLSVLGTSKAVNISSGWLNGIALGALVGQQVLNSLSPVLTADQVQTFQQQVLQPAAILDSGSCIERTVFITMAPVAGASRKTKPPVLGNFEFHVH